MDHISIGPGDTFRVTQDYDGYWAVKIEQTAFVEEPRWITFSSTSYDAETRAYDLAASLTDVARRIRQHRDQLADQR